MYILGISIEYIHDPSACLIKDGQVIAAAEEERFVRVKFGRGHSFPAKAIGFCLKQAGITLNDVDYIGLSVKPWLLFRRTIIQNIPTLFQSKELFQFSAYTCARSLGFFAENLRIAIELKRTANHNSRLYFIEHHTCHAASTFFVSPFDKAAILTIDNRGENVSSTLSMGEKNKITRIQEIRNPHSLGALYLSFTRHLGFDSGDEYKVMGLASYGKPRYAATLRDMVYCLPKGRFKLNPEYFTYLDQCYFSPKANQILGPKRMEGKPIEERHADIAASLQLVLEETVLHMVKYLHEVTKLKNLCIAGGVGLNCAMNGRLLKESPFERIFVQPAANDAGNSLGATLHIYHSILGHPRNYVMDHAYLGTEFSEEEVRHALEISKIRYEYRKDITKVAAKLLSEGNIIGWFQGRMEWGPRALGSRSILANPTRPNMKDKINKYIKFREEFRPFAPSVLEENASEYFQCNNHFSPFMLFVVDVLPEKKKVIPAVTHVDGTARLHTVSKKANPLYYELIEEFGRITGVPVILNTSFNVKGEPIVNSPREAISCFSSTGMDYLVMGYFLIKK